MQDMPRRSHKLVTYGKNSNKSQCSTSKSSGTPAFHANSTEQQGTSTVLPSSGRPIDRQLQPKVVRHRGSKPRKTRASGALDDPPGKSSSLDEHAYHFQPSPGDDDQDSGTVKRKRRKLVPDGQRDVAHGFGVDDNMHSAVEFADASPERLGNIQTRTGSNRNQNEKRDGRRTSSHLPLHPRPDTAKGRGERFPPRKKLVDLLGSVPSSTERLPTVHTSNSESNDIPCPLPSTSARRRDSSQQPQTSDPYETKCYDTHTLENSAAAPSPNLRGSRVTYARQRSFLNEVSASDDVEDTNANLHSKQGQITSEMTSNIDMNVDHDMNDVAGPVRSIHELRQAGDNSRFRSAVDCIFEDIADGDHSISTRCNGFVQLSSKLLDRQFARRFAEYGFAEKLVEYVTSDLDIISASFALCSYELVHLSGAFPHTNLTSFWSKLLDISSRLLEVEDDILILSKRRSFGLSKAVQISIQRSMPILSSAIRDDQAPSILTPRFLVLRSIRSVLLGFQQNDDSIKIMPTAILDKLVNLLVAEQHPGIANPSLLPQDFQEIFLLLSILETYTILLGSLPIDHQDTLQPLTRINHFLDPKESESNDSSRQIRTLYIRVILNLTNNDSSFCNEFVTPELVGGLVRMIISEFCIPPEGYLAEEKNSINTVILALGTLINLTEKNDLARTVFLSATDGSVSFLHLLLQKFSANVGLATEAHSVHETYYSVVIGYLSVLLVTLCLNMEAYSQVKDFLGNKGLRIALSTADEFQHYHQRVEQDLRASGARGSSRSNFTAQLQDIICQVRQLERSL